MCKNSEAGEAAGTEKGNCNGKMQPVKVHYPSF